MFISINELFVLDTLFYTKNIIWNDLQPNNPVKTYE